MITYTLWMDQNTSAREALKFAMAPFMKPRGRPKLDSNHETTISKDLNTTWVLWNDF